MTDDRENAVIRQSIKGRTMKVTIELPIFAHRIKQHRLAAGMTQQDLIQHKPSAPMTRGRDCERTY